MSAEKVKKDGCICWISNQKTHQRRAIAIHHDGCEERAWLSFAEVVSKFLGNTNDSDCKTIVENVLVCFEALGCRISLKVHFLQAHFRLYSTKLG